MLILGFAAPSRWRECHDRGRLLGKEFLLTHTALEVLLLYRSKEPIDT